MAIESISTRTISTTTMLIITTKTTITIMPTTNVCFHTWLRFIFLACACCLCIIPNGPTCVDRGVDVS